MASQGTVVLSLCSVGSTYLSQMFNLFAWKDIISDFYNFFQPILSPRTSCPPVVCLASVQRSNPKTSCALSCGFTCGQQTWLPPSSCRSLASNPGRRETTLESESDPWRLTPTWVLVPGRVSTSSLCCRLGCASRKPTTALKSTPMTLREKIWPSPPQSPERKDWWVTSVESPSDVLVPLNPPFLIPFQQPFIEVKILDSPKRSRRDSGLNCDEESAETRCCRYPLTVDFEEFGWDWIIAPKRYRANYCSGECEFLHLQQYPHAHLVNKANPRGTAGPCCTPTKMSPINMLYFNRKEQIIYGKIPSMVVDHCGCSWGHRAGHRLHHRSKMIQYLATKSQTSHIYYLHSTRNGKERLSSRTKHTTTIFYRSNRRSPEHNTGPINPSIWTCCNISVRAKWKWSIRRVFEWGWYLLWVPQLLDVMQWQK